MPSGELIGIILGSNVLVALVSTAVTWLMSRRKLDAEATKTIGEAWEALNVQLTKDNERIRIRVQELECEVQKLKDENKAKDKRIKELEAEIAVLRSQMK